jgi:hypothetical protein
MISEHIYYDICEACRQIIGFTSGLSFEEYASNDLVKAAAERKFVTNALESVLPKIKQL